MPKPNKTQPTTASVDAFIDKQTKEEVRDDCRTLMALMHALTGEEPYMYGPSIIGYGTYHYKYASGREGDAPVLGFSPRKPAMVIYLYSADMDPELMAKLGKHKATKGCVYIKRLADVDLEVLKALLQRSIELTRQAYP